MTGTPHVVVIGGGLAGLAAAISCTDGGARVTLFEGRPRFGGATWSFERNGLSFDNGQHVYLRCCTAYRRFLERIGTADKAPLQRRLALPVLAPSRAGGPPRLAWIRRNGLPVPFNLAPALLSYRHLSLRERLGLGRAVVALSRLRLSDPVLDTETFAEFLARHGQSPRTVRALFDVIALPTTNVRSHEGALTMATKVFQTGLLSETGASDIGWAHVPLTALHVDPALTVLRDAGAAVHGRARVQAIEMDETRRSARGVLVDGEHVEADAVVLAVPHTAAAELVPPGGVIDPASLHGLGQSPIVDVHLVYDRAVTPYPLAAAIDSPVQFVFDKTVAAGMSPADGQCLSISISGADAELGERPDVLIERYSTAINHLFPTAAAARLVDAVVSREHEATFRAVPGTAQLRPGAATGFDNLFLAGAWTNTGWPATMEGAVRSGVAAGGLALANVGSAPGDSARYQEVLA